jgi:hypothetical protein
MMSPSRADHEPPEHARWAHYQQTLARVPDADETALVAAVLEDPDQAMAQSAVAGHLDLRATALHHVPAYLAWAERMAGVIDHYPFLAQRLHEWSLFRAITLATPWSADTLIAASDWLQHKVATSATSPEALTVLAESGRTRRVRNTAKSKINRKSR